MLVNESSILTIPSVRTYSERTRSVTSGGPAGTPVETHALIRNDLEETTATEGLGVCLTLNLQNVQREEDDLTNTDQTRTQKLATCITKITNPIRITHLPAVACIIAFPLPFPKALSNSLP